MTFEEVVGGTRLKLLRSCMILLSRQCHPDLTEFAPAMAEDAPLLPGLSPIAGKAVHVAFDGGRLTSDAGVLVLSQIERRLGLAERLAACLNDPRSPDRIRHDLAEMIRFRMLMIAAGYEDANDCDALRADPVFKMAVGRLPESGADLCSQPTMCRLENLPGRITLARMMDAMVELYCGSFAIVPRRIALDIDDTLDRVSRSSAALAVPCPSRSPLFLADPHLRRWQRQAGRHEAPGGQAKISAKHFETS